MGGVHINSISPLPTPSRPALPITTQDNETVSPQKRDDVEQDAMEDDYEEEHTPNVGDYEDYEEYLNAATETTREAQEDVHEKEKEEQEEDYDEL